MRRSTRTTKAQAKPTTMLFVLAAAALLLASGAAAAQTVVATIPVGWYPFSGAAVNPATNRVYIANLNSGPTGGVSSISVVDGATNTVVGTIPTPQITGVIRAVSVNPATNRIYVGSWTTGGGVVVIDGVTQTIVAIVPVPCAAGTAVNPATNRIYTSQPCSNSVLVIDGASNTVIATVTGVGPYPGPIEVNPATNRVYVGNGNGTSVSVIDGGTNTVTATLGIGSSPGAIAVNPTTNRVYVTHYPGNGFSVIDGATNVVAIVSSSPAVGVGVNPGTGKIYMSNWSNDTVTVFDGTTNAVVATVPLAAGSTPFGVAVNPVTGLVYVNQLWANLVSGTVSVIFDGITVAIDILPRIFPNRLNLRLLPAIPVAVLTTPSFNAADVVVSTVRFAGAAPALSALVDVDGDGDRDLALLFATRDVNLTCASTQATLTGQTTTGTQIQGTDSVRITRDKTGQVCP